MIRSLYSGISGMRNHQTRMDVTGNNIANVNTTGFKAGRVNFQDTLSQTVRSGGDGRNPAQVGSGMTVGSVSNNFTQGPMQSTGRTLDTAIQGNGFFTLKDSAGNEFYSREGIFFLDDEGYLVNSDGLKVQSSQGDIKIYNGPVSTIAIGPNGAITGTNTAGEPLQFTSGGAGQSQPTTVIEASLVGAAITEPVPLVSANGSLSGDAIKTAGSPHEEAKVAGNSVGVVQLGVSLPAVNMAGAATYELTLEYNDGDTAIGPVTLNTNLTSVESWADLASQLQAAIDDPAAIGPNKVKVSYNDSPFGSLAFETVTNPDDTNASGDPIEPTITLAGAGVAKYMGTATTLTDTGKAVTPMDWTGKTFKVDVGDGWQEIELVADFNAINPAWASLSTGLDKVTSGTDLAQKLQALMDAYAGDNPHTTSTKESQANVKVSWSTDHLVFTPEAGYSKITLGGTDINDFVGAASTVSNNSMDWTNRDISINYNGTNYTFSQYEKQMAGLNNIKSGAALAAALNKMFDDKIGADKVDVSWSGQNLVFNTKATTGVGVKPTLTIGGANAADFVGSNPTVKTGTASMLPPAASQEPNNVIRLATFQNAEGLTKAGKNLYQSSESSGTVTFGTANSPGFGSIQSGYLEMSNVDLTEEFTNMITTQRGYQANARVITVSDSLLEELIQLKR